MSGNFARSQLRNYHQEITLIYNDKTMASMFDARYTGMMDCVRTCCSTSKGFPRRSS